ncbi:hypothetical protein LOZ12_003119 [Ophidiomyces ophidiicola]|nr:hypothetical protein LOZ62_003011 [Ophidiomyces ophidiicola]KAI2052057.1 hypothetical protein LOZ38_002396 [Ophidiomyces ophidiicola]KAI2054712.1 hypothetical protein LOZ44_002315 [Ophidiomyces ophidiicola]KAI2077556.1 hypothetical protein LOZ39_002121 [Ophidiomyces ophidiicola]KAI2081651.1 hypothetical protein LOZ37_001183 [Ophidiomyces ophidiicola]
MFLCHVLQRSLSILLPISIASLVYLYLYPVFHGCAFPVPASDLSGPEPALASFTNILKEHFRYGNQSRDSKQSISPAPFRLLVLADPQIEGDSSLPGPNDGLAGRFWKHWNSVVSAETWEDRFFALRKGTKQVLLVDIPRSLETVRKQVDLVGNDYYLAHIYRTLHWWVIPSHVTVLGDLIGSQWVSDTEFAVRSGRYWNQVFRGGVRVDDEITITGMNGYGNGAEKTEMFTLSKDRSEKTAWSSRIINIAGNHDVGYAGDISEKRLDRFEREFGRHNWDVRFQYPISAGNDPEGKQINASIHLIVLDSLLLDTPALSQSLASQTYGFINDLISHRLRPVEDQSSFTLLLTHLPLHKEAGVCTDAPLFAFFSKDDDKPIDGELRFKEGGLREQNHISAQLSHHGILQGIFGMSGEPNAVAGGMGRNGLILTGHDHTGCDTEHFINRTSVTSEDSSDTSPAWTWDARLYKSENKQHYSSPPNPSIREITLRSMMGEFSGNAGLLSLWFDSRPSVMEWKYEFTTCQLGVQHIWWAVHIICLVTSSIVAVWLGLVLLGRSTNADVAIVKSMAPPVAVNLKIKQVYKPKAT